METLDRLLAEHPFFEGLDQEYVSFLAGCAKNVRFQQGEFLLREGEPADAFFIIRHGRVALEIDTPGRGSIVVQTVGEGEVIGYSWLFSPYRWRFDARALELTRALSLDGACLRGKCEEDPKLGYELMKRFAGIVLERLEATRMQLLDVYGQVWTQ
jgi:CRP/FNR family transcriptional regulator, cyclic AMP receptor protein